MKPIIVSYEVWAATEDDFVRKAEFAYFDAARKYADSERKTNKGTILVRRVQTQCVYTPDEGWCENA